MTTQTDSQHVTPLGVTKTTTVLLLSLSTTSLLLIGIGVLNNWSIAIETGKTLGFLTAITLGAILGLYST